LAALLVMDSSRLFFGFFLGAANEFQQLHRKAKIGPVFAVFAGVGYGSGCALQLYYSAFFNLR